MLNISLVKTHKMQQNCSRYFSIKNLWCHASPKNILVHALNSKYILYTLQNCYTLTA